MKLLNLLYSFIFMNANFMWEFLTNEDFQFEVLFVNYKLLEGFAKDILSLGSHHMPEEAYWSIEKQITSKGYMFETHSILTDDGYYLKALRVPGRVNSSASAKKKQPYPIYMQHGLLDSGGTWFYNDQTLSLSYQLVDLGYDVWVTNSRGTVYSNKHQKFSDKDRAYWNFSFHEMAKYDVPANLQYILNTTGASQVIYIGHSQGTT